MGRHSTLNYTGHLSCNTDRVRDVVVKDEMSVGLHAQHQHIQEQDHSIKLYVLVQNPLTVCLCDEDEGRSMYDTHCIECCSVDRFD